MLNVVFVEFCSVFPHYEKQAIEARVYVWWWTTA